MRQPSAGTFPFGVVILAAGRSQRMGRPKLLLPWGRTSVLGHLVAQWQHPGARQIVVVCAAGDQGISTELDRLGFPAGERIDNPAPEFGMFSSIQCAARWPDWQTDLTHWALVLGDQPHLRSTTIKAVIELAATHPQQVCQPSWLGQPRHPVVLPGAMFAQCATTPAANLKDFLTTCPRALCELDDPGLNLDIDTPQDYERALRLAGQS